MSKSLPKYRSRQNNSFYTNLGSNGSSGKRTKIVLKKKSQNETLPEIEPKKNSQDYVMYELAPDRWSATGWKYKAINSNPNNYITNCRSNNFINDVNQQISSFKTRNYNWVRMM